MAHDALQEVERIVPRVDPALGAFLSMRLALAEAAIGDHGAAFDRFQAIPATFHALGVRWSASAILEKAVMGAPPEAAAELIERLDAPLRTSWLVRSAHARHEKGDREGARWLLREAEARWGGLEPMLGSYTAEDDGTPERAEDGIGAREVCYAAEIRLVDGTDDPDPIDRALSRIIADYHPLAQEHADAEWRDGDPDPSTEWILALETQIRLRLSTGNVAGIAGPLETLSPFLESASVLWEIARHPGGAASLRGPPERQARVRTFLLVDVVDALVADEDTAGALAVLDLLPHGDPDVVKSRVVIHRLAKAYVRGGEFDRAAELAGAWRLPWWKVEALLAGYRATGERRYVERAREAAEDAGLREYPMKLAEALAERGEVEEALKAADRLAVDWQRLKARRAVARAHLESGDAERAAAVLLRGRGTDHEWYRVAARSALAELQIERGDLDGALATALSISKLPPEGMSRFWRRRPEPDVIHGRYHRQVLLLRALVRARGREGEQGIPAWIDRVRDPFLLGICLIELACPLPDEWP